MLAYAPDVLLLHLPLGAHYARSVPGSIAEHEQDRSLTTNGSASAAAAEHSLPEIANLASQPGWWALPAVQSGQVYIVDPARLSTPGPRVVEGVEVLSRILHPDLVEHKAPPGSVLKLWLDHGQRCRPRQLRNFFKEYN